MAFNFFGFKKRSDIQDVEPKQVVNKPETEIVPEPEMAPDAQVVDESSQPVSKASEDLAASETQEFVATREDVIAAYKIFLGRMPESEDVLATWIGVKPQAILVDFLKSQEFINNVQKSTFILALAKKVLDDRRQAENNESSGANDRANSSNNLVASDAAATS